MTWPVTPVTGKLRFTEQQTYLLMHRIVLDAQVSHPILSESSAFNFLPNDSASAFDSACPSSPVRLPKVVTTPSGSNLRAQVQVVRHLLGLQKTYSAAMLSIFDTFLIFFNFSMFFWGKNKKTSPLISFAESMLNDARKMDKFRSSSESPMVQCGVAVSQAESADPLLCCEKRPTNLRSQHAQESVSVEKRVLS